MMFFSVLSLSRLFFFSLLRFCSPLRRGFRSGGRIAACCPLAESRAKNDPKMMFLGRIINDFELKSVFFLKKPLPGDEQPPKCIFFAFWGGFGHFFSFVGRQKCSKK